MACRLLAVACWIFFVTCRSGRGENPSPEVRGMDERSNSRSKELQRRRSRRAERSCSTSKVRRGGCEEIPLFQGKEQWLHFAGVAVKRYPTSKVREAQVIW